MAEMTAAELTAERIRNRLLTISDRARQKWLVEEIEFLLAIDDRVAALRNSGGTAPDTEVGG